MRNMVCVVNGYVIYVDAIDCTYHVWLGNLDFSKGGKHNVKVWKRLNSAIKWCEQN